MYFYVDESGNTGANLFDESQPILYYGVLSSHLNIDNLAGEALSELRKHLGVERLHANELGMGGLVKIADGLIHLQRHLNLSFDFYTIYKHDHALLCFFDQVFDQGLNPAVPWSGYWTPLRYILLWKVAILFDVEILQKAWNARIQLNDDLSTKDLVEVCQVLLTRLNVIPDKHSRQIVRDSIRWAINNPQELRYNAKDKRDAYWITPNLIGFQNVMHGIASRIKNGVSKPPVIVVDQQAQFNKTQQSLAEFYAEAKGFQYKFHTGLPDIDYTGMPDTPILFRSGRESAGLELVDVYLWLFKRFFEKKEVAPELYPLISQQIHIGMYSEMSLSAIEKYWLEWFANLPEPTPEQWETGKKLVDIGEKRRLKAIASDKRHHKKISSQKQ
jgi:hypothetical protein